MPIGAGLIWEIYSVRSNSWKKIDVTWWKHVVDGLQILGLSKIYLNGVCRLGGIGHSPRGVKYLVLFNLSSEAFVTTPLLLDMLIVMILVWKRAT